MKKGVYKKRESERKRLWSHLLGRELEAISESLYFSGVAREDYPELADIFCEMGHAHAENTKRLEAMLKCGGRYGFQKKIRINTDKIHKGGIEEMISRSCTRYREDLLSYERLYLLSEEEREEELIKEILRASNERLSILEKILKT